MHLMKKLLLIVIILLFGGFLWYRTAQSPVNPHDENRTMVKIPKGSSLRDIAGILKAEKLIRSKLAFLLVAKQVGAEKTLQAGNYLLTPSMGIAEIIAALRRGIAEEGVVTIPEGFTVKDIDALLAEKKVIQSGELISCAQTCSFSGSSFLPQGTDLAPRGGRLEGYLYPDTYYIAVENFTAETFLERLLQTFERKILEQFSADVKKSPRSLHEIITMASLIEEESRRDEERTTVAGILWKRYDAGAGLGVDAAVRYILEKPTGALTVKDLNVNSAYNLRKFRGLPPGPIANPGFKSIQAALHPKDSPYWYYLHDANGIIHYAISNEEHNINKYKYLK